MVHSNVVDKVTSASLVPLPEKPLTRLIKPIVRFLQIEAIGGGAVLVGTLLALFLANSSPADDYAALWTTPVGIQVGSFSFVLSLKEVINDGLMTLFFFVVGLEIKRELILGELRKPRVAAFSIAAAIGGMAVPAGLYLGLELGQGGERGWGIVMATDIAFVIACLAILGSRVPHNLRVFVLSLAIIDDIGAVLVIALAYTAEIHLISLALCFAGIGAVLGLQRLGVRSIPVYFVIGMFSWFAIHEAGIHPTIMGVILGILTPVYPWVGRRRLQTIASRVGNYLRGIGGQKEEQAELLRTVAVAAREALSPLQRLETMLHPWVNFLILPMFAFANAGIELSSSGLGDATTVAVVVGLVLGKPIGILAGCLIAVWLRLAVRPHGLRWTVVTSAGALCGLGFTMSLFIANLAFEGQMLQQASLGILAASMISAVLGLALLAGFLRPADG
jgi:NhaA family Na+:H+ antiporter